MDKSIKKSIKTVFDYLSISDLPEKADAIFVATSHSINPPKRAAELYKKGFSKHIFIVGKTGRFSDPTWKEDQAVVYKKELIKFGIPTKSIIADPSATNSLEEALKAIPLMRKKSIKPKKIIIIDRPEHQRREWATFSKTWPGIKFINCPAYEPLKYNQRMLDLVVAELERLKTYAKKGDLVPQDFPKNVLSAWRELKLKVVDTY